MLGPYAGVIADRVDKRRLMVVLQSLMGIQALVLGVLAVTHVVTFWQVCVLALCLASTTLSKTRLGNRLCWKWSAARMCATPSSLNSTMVNAARAVGPAVAGIIIAVAGEGVCFFINAVSFVAVVYSLVAMDKGTLRPSVPVTRAKGQLREGLRYIAHEPRLAIPLLMMGLVGTLAYEFQVSLPVLAKETFPRRRRNLWLSDRFYGRRGCDRWPRDCHPRENGPARPQYRRRSSSGWLSS